MSLIALLQPAALETRAAQPLDDVGAAAHDVPDQTGAVVLDHEHDRALVHAEVVWGDPPSGRAVFHGEGLVERRLEAVGLRHTQLQRGQVPDSGDHDLRGERQRGDHNPRSDCAVVGAVGRPAGDVFVELPLDLVHRSLHPARAITGREPPTVLPVALELQRVPDGVLLLHKGRLPTVLEVVGAVLAHEGVADAAEIDPQVRELMLNSGPE